MWDGNQLSFNSTLPFLYSWRSRSKKWASLFRVWNEHHYFRFSHISHYTLHITVTGSIFLPVVSPTMNFSSRNFFCLSLKGLFFLIDFSAQPSSSFWCKPLDVAWLQWTFAVAEIRPSLTQSFLLYKTFSLSITDSFSSLNSHFPYFRHTLTPSLLNSKLFSLLFPGHFTLALLELLPCTRDTRAPDTPPREVSAERNCSAVRTSLPSLTKERTWKEGSAKSSGLASQGTNQNLTLSVLTVRP